MVVREPQFVKRPGELHGYGWRGGGETRRRRWRWRWRWGERACVSYYGRSTRCCYTTLYIHTTVTVNTHTVHMYTDRSGLCPPLLFSASSSPHLLQPLDALKDVAAHGEDLKVGHAAEGNQSVDGIC